MNFDNNDTELGHYLRSEYEVSRPIGDKVFYDNNLRNNPDYRWILNGLNEEIQPLDPESEPKKPFVRMLRRIIR